jgi:hypothetical protein
MNLLVATLRSTTGYHLMAPPGPKIREFEFASKIFRMCLRMKMAVVSQ